MRPRDQSGAKDKQSPSIDSNPSSITAKQKRGIGTYKRKQISKYKEICPSSVKLFLQPYDLQQANHIRNCLPKREEGVSPTDNFTYIPVSHKLRENHTFGWPIYSVHNRLQYGIISSKCSPREIMGLYLGPYPRHVRFVNLVQNLEMKIVSPHFHIQRDDLFEKLHLTEVNTPTASN